MFVAPLVAVTLARFGAATAGRRRTGAACFVRGRPWWLVCSTLRTASASPADPEKPRTAGGFGLSAHSTPAVFVSSHAQLARCSSSTTAASQIPVVDY